MPPSHRTRPGFDPTQSDVRTVAFDHGLVTEEASFLEHRAALDATVLAPTSGEEVVLELRAGVLRRSV